MIICELFEEKNTYFLATLSIQDKKANTVVQITIWNSQQTSPTT